MPNARELCAIRVPSLDGSGKMGKSDGNTISLIDKPEVIMKKVMAAKTDAGPIIGQEMSQEMNNLYYLMELCSSPEIYSKFKKKYEDGEQNFYGELKKQLANDIIDLLTPIREKYYSKACSDERVRRILCSGRYRLRPLASRVLKSVQGKFCLHDQELELAAALNKKP